MRARRRDLVGRAARRPRRRRRLLHVLPAPRDGGARRRQGPGGRARGGRGDVGPRRADLRLHRDGRDGRHVPGRQRRLHSRSASARSSSSRSPCSARSPCCPRCCSWLGEKGWTEKGRVPCLGGLRHRNHGESRVWSAILDRVLERPVVSATAATLRARRARRPRVRHAHHQPGRGRPAAQPADHADLRPHPGRVPRRPAAGRDRRPRRRRALPRGAGRDRAAARARRRSRRTSASRSRRRSTRATISRSSACRWPATAPTRARRPRSPRSATTVIPRDARARRGRAGRRDRHDRRLEGLQRHDQVAHADRVRVRPRPRVHPPARHVPVDRDPDQGDRAQPAVGRRRLRRAHARLPGRARREAARTSTRSAASRRGCRCSCS